MKKFVLNEGLAVEGKTQRKEMRPVWRWLRLSDFLKIEKKTLKIRKIRTKILAQELGLKGSTLYLSVAENEKEDEDKIEEMIDVYNNLGVNYLILKGKKEKIASLIYHTLEKYSDFQDIVYISLDCDIEAPSKIKEKVRALNKKGIDFACVNSLAYPEAFKGLGKVDDVNLNSCEDPRFLNCVNDNILYFRNNRFGKDILKVWEGSSCPHKISSSQRLSISFNKYLMIIPSRVEWLAPSFSFNVKYLTPKGREYQSVIKVENYPKIDKSESNYLYLAQCGEKRGVSLKDESHFATHYKGSVYKRKK